MRRALPDLYFFFSVLIVYFRLQVLERHVFEHLLGRDVL